MVKSKLPKNLPKYTYGLEGKLVSLIGEPIALAQKAVSPKFKKERSTSDVNGSQYTYHIQNGLTYLNLPDIRSRFIFEEQEKLFPHTIPTTTLHYTFSVNLWADLNGNLKSFSFTLQVS